MADNKKKNTRPTQEEIVKGKIANALTSAAKNHIVATTDDLYDTNLLEYQDEINKRLSDSITNIEQLIPGEATPENQLADKQYVLDLIHSTSSAFRGNWNTWDDVPTNSEEYPEDGEGNRIPRQGDYIVIVDASEYIGEDTGKTYDGSWRFVYEGEWEINNKNGWKPEYQINEKPELTIHFRKKKEGGEISEPITDVKVTDENTLLTYPELKYSEFVNGGYWDTDITTLRNVTGETTVYYVTPFLTITDNETLLKICYNNGWSSSPDHLTINEAESITDEMVAEASKKLSLIEDEQGNLIEVFDSIVFVEEGEEPIVMTSYNLYDGLCYDKNGNEYNITDCHCYSKDGKRYGFDVVKYGNCFYELESWAELPYFTGITKLSDGETYRVFLDYSHIRDINLENIASLPAYTLFRCTNLENIFIPSGLTDIETYAIASCDGLQSLVVDENNPKYTSRNSQGAECNCIIEKPTRRVSALTLIQGCNVSILPDNIKHIASGAFDECTRLTSITLPDGLLTMGDNVFRGCTALSGNIVVPETVESIGESTFRNCTDLQGVSINVPVISNYLFKDCSGLINVTLGNNVTTIGNQAFMNDSSLTAITIPDSITVAGTSAFANCDLRSVNTNNIETISANLFANNTHLSSITMTDSTVNIGDYAFDSASISAITIPQNIRSLSNTAFMNCNNLQRVVWDVNDTALNRYANKFNNNLETITIFEFGEHCTVIPNGLCGSLINIDEISIPNTIVTIGNGAFSGSGLLEITIPDSVTTIGHAMCLNCVSLETVTIGSGVTLISPLCFSGNTNLETVDLSNNPNKINLRIPLSVFDACPNLSLIIVPDELIADYRESQDWAQYRHLIFGKSVYTITFDSMSGETTPSTQNVRCGAYIENPGTVHKDLYEFEYWEDEDGNEWNFEEDYVIGNMTLYAHYREVKAIMVKSISNDVTNISMSYNGSYQANVEYSYDGLNWYNIWNNNNLAISLSEGYSNYVYFRGYNPNGFSRRGGNYSWFNINNGQCDLLGNIMYLKDYNQELNTVGRYEFYRLFQSCYAIVNTEGFKLPATTLASDCYNAMFSGCSSLLSAPELPATTLAYDCYQSMFLDCTSLTTAPVLPATTLADYCYSSMFYNCTSLTTAPELPATALASGCYNSMFQNCTSLTATPELPATTLPNWCYQSMFQGCTSLTTTPELPATTLAQSCYDSMFNGCTSLTTAPELPATTLANWCYYSMFFNCTSLNYIKCLAVNGINQNSSTSNWVNGVSNSGTFVKHPNATSWPTGYGYNGIPTNWTIEDAKPENYITFTALEDNAPISLNRISRNQKLLYSTDDGETWNNFTTGITITLENSGDACYVAGMLSGNNTNNTYTQFNLPNRVSVSGNINSLWNYIDLKQNLYRYCGYYLFNGCAGLVDASGLSLCTTTTTLADYCYSYMFYNCSSLTTASSTLPATTLASHCYEYMFQGCSSLTTAPALPAVILASCCYGSMFGGCTSLTAAPELPATTLANGCYNYMFRNCSNLTTAPELPATTLADSCYNGMFEYCTGLTTAPELPATTLATNCYNSMFADCSSLTTAPELPATTLAIYCYQYMFSNCTSLTTAPGLPATTLASSCYNSMFYGCTSLTTAPSILPATTLEDGCYQGMFSRCSSLTTAPELPATTLAGICYASMFSRCSSLTTAPALPATTLASNCYSEMFRGCTSLTAAPELPATTLAAGCYQSMFEGCSSLTTPPELPATTLASYCYNSMFYGCTRLNYIKCLAINGINQNSSTYSWVYGVQTNNGTFVKHPEATSWPTGVNGIPTNWTIEDAVIE